MKSMLHRPNNMKSMLHRPNSMKSMLHRPNNMKSMLHRPKSMKSMLHRPNNMKSMLCVSISIQYIIYLYQYIISNASCCGTTASFICYNLASFNACLF